MAKTHYSVAAVACKNDFENWNNTEYNNNHNLINNISTSNTHLYSAIMSQINQKHKKKISSKVTSIVTTPLARVTSLHLSQKSYKSIH